MAYKVIYDRAGCIGANACVGALAEYWSLDGEKKAVLKGSALNAATGHYELLIQDQDFDRFKESAVVCPVFVIDIIDTGTQKSVLNLVTPEGVQKESAPVISAKPAGPEAPADPKGYFTIRLRPDSGVIQAHYYSPKHQLLFIVEGRSARDVCGAILREGFVSTLAYAAYLGAELQKAETALRRGLEYKQDQPLP